MEEDGQQQPGSGPCAPTHPRLVRYVKTGLFHVYDSTRAAVRPAEEIPDRTSPSLGTSGAGESDPGQVASVKPSGSSQAPGEVSTLTAQAQPGPGSTNREGCRFGSPRQSRFFLVDRSGPAFPAAPTI